MPRLVLRTGLCGALTETRNTKIPVVVARLVGTVKAHSLAVQLHVTYITVALLILQTCKRDARFASERALKDAVRGTLTIADIFQSP